MRPTLDGLDASQWFAIAVTGTEFLLVAVLLWFAGRCVRRGVGHLAATRRAERERQAAWEAHRALRSRSSETPLAYLRERGRGLVSETPWQTKN